MNVVIAAGGTGGHTFPAVALAEEFTRLDPRGSVTLIGTGKTLEDTMLAGQRVQRERLNVRGIVGRGFGASVMAMLLIPGAIWQAMRVLRARCADLVIGTGGYTSPPVILAACALGIRRALLEPNAMPGLANRLVGPLADRVFLSFDAAKRFFHPERSRTIGVPVRKAFRETPPPSPSRVNTVLICGGSQGARALNAAMVGAVGVSRVLREEVTIIHQTGANDVESVKAAYAEAQVSAQVMAFIPDMPTVLRSADLVISRCGALTLAELAAWGKAAILIPFPFATHGHQEQNARAVEQAGAGVVILQSELTPARLAGEIERFVRQPELLREMSAKSLTLRRVDSAERMVRECLELVGG